MVCILLTPPFTLFNALPTAFFPAAAAPAAAAANGATGDAGSVGNPLGSPHENPGKPILGIDILGNDGNVMEGIFIESEGSDGKLTL